MGKDEGYDCPNGRNAEGSTPWLDGNGKLLCKTKLKKISRQWDADTWERYLRSIEHYQHEQLVDNFDEVAHQYSAQEAMNRFWTNPYPDFEKNNVELEARVRELVEDLPLEEKMAIHALFYDRLSLREAAEKMNRSHTQIAKLRDAAVEKLRVILEGRKPGVQKSEK